MTDTTDIAALIKSAMLSCAEVFAMEIAVSLEYDIGRDLTDAEHKQVTDAVSGLLHTAEQLEAERQRAEALQGQLDYRNEVLTRAIRQREAAEVDTEHYRKAWKDKADELAELKGDQVPVAYLIHEKAKPARLSFQNLKGFVSQSDIEEHELWQEELFTAPQKPVVRFTPPINPVMFNADVMFGYNKARAEDKAAIEAAGGKVAE